MNVKIQQSTTHQTDKQSYQFRYGDDLIGFERVERKNDARRILIKVHPDCRVIVQAPSDASDDDVMQAVKKRSRWISSKLDGFKSQLSDVRTRQYISGESHYYLGRQHMLKVEVKSDQKPQVKLLHGRLEVTVKKHDPSKVKHLLNNWYKSRAKEVFQRRLMAVMDETMWVKEKPPIRILAMQTQWGSCSPNGLLTLNPHLVKAPRECVDYVILHELCHLVEHNHSEQFYRTLDTMMPDWKRIKCTLDSQCARYLNG